MEVGVRLEGGGIELATARGDDGAEFVERGEVPIDDWLVHQGPEVLGGLKFGGIGRQEDQADPVRNREAFGSMPARIVEHEDNAALAACPGLAALPQEAWLALSLQMRVTARRSGDLYSLE